MLFVKLCLYGNTRTNASDRIDGVDSEKSA